jgi:6-phosphogluconolactonase
MTTSVVPGKVVAPRETRLVAHEAALRMAGAIREAIAERGSATVALSGGNTPRDAYTILAREAGIDWGKVHVFWVDERVAAPEDERSNYHWARLTLLDPAKVPSANVHRMVTDAPDLPAAARDYEALLREHLPLVDGVPAFDVMVMGIGDDGHTASLFPGKPAVDVRDRFVIATEAAAGLEPRMTVTVPVIQAARHVLVLIVGAGKRAALERAWSARGDVHQTPSRILRDCRGELTWIVDRAAAGLDAND